MAIGFFFIRFAKKAFVLEKYSFAKCIRYKKRIAQNEYIFENEYFSKRILFVAERKTNICLKNTFFSKTNATSQIVKANASSGNTFYGIFVYLKTNTILTNTFLRNEYMVYEYIFGNE